jgi:exonuclease SbcD
MKILHTADWHVGKPLRGRSRIEEHVQVLAEIVQLAEDERVDLVLVAGDLFESSAPTAEAEKVVYDALLALAATGAEVVVIAGNHDSPQRLEAVAPLLSQVHICAGFEIKKPSEGGVLRVRTKSGEEANVVLVPFLSQRYAVRASELMSQEAAENKGDYIRVCGDILTRLCADLPGNAINILVGHLHILGGTLGGGEREAHTVLDYYLPPQVFPSCLHYVALGHLHAPQQILGSCPIWYCGSPLQLDFGETRVENSVLLVEARAGDPATARPVALKSGRKLRVVRGSLDSLVSGDYGDDYLKLVLDDVPRIGLADEARERIANVVAVELATPAAFAGERGQSLDGATPSELFSSYLESAGVKDEGLMKVFELLMERNSEGRALAG